MQEKPHHHYNVGTTSGDWYRGRLNDEGIPYSTMRDGTPKGYSFLNINGNQYTIDYKVAGRPGDYRIKIYAPKVVEKDKSTTAGIAANFFMGSEQDTLYYRIDDGEWKRMWKREIFDPAYFYDVLQWDHTEELFEGRRPSNPTECNHIWIGRIDPGLPEGKHAIEVKVNDMFGRIFIQKSSYRIEAL